MPELINIAIVGNGNVGTYFRKALNMDDINVLGFARHPKGNDFLLQELHTSADNFDLILLCVNDDAIAEVSARIPQTSALLAHVSGAMDLEHIDAKHKHRGVFYPLMSLKDNLNVSAAAIPFCLETEKEEDLEVLKLLVKKLKATYYPVDSTKRAYLHLAAVLAQNFTNHLYLLARQTLQEVDLGFKILMPLIENSLEKLKHQNPGELQTGPAIRGDEETIKKHLELIKDPLTADIYKLLTQSIQQSHDKKL